jgi:hypothetical protein
VLCIGRLGRAGEGWPSSEGDVFVGLRIWKLASSRPQQICCVA